MIPESTLTNAAFDSRKNSTTLNREHRDRLLQVDRQPDESAAGFSKTLCVNFSDSMHEFKMAGCAVNDTKAEESQVHNLTQSSTVKILSRDVVCASKTLSASQNMPPFDLNREAAIDEIAEEREFQSPDCGAKKWMRHSNATMTMNARVSRSDEEAI